MAKKKKNIDEILQQLNDYEKEFVNQYNKIQEDETFKKLLQEKENLGNTENENK